MRTHVRHNTLCAALVTLTMTLGAGCASYQPAGPPVHEAIMGAVSGYEQAQGETLADAADAAVLVSSVVRFWVHARCGSVRGFPVG